MKMIEDPVIFKMDKWSRNKLIREHVFYVEQAKKRLLGQFEDIDNEADQFGQRCLSDNAHKFNQNNDSGYNQEDAYDEMCEFHALLTEMHMSTRLSIISGMFHNCEKQVKDWIIGELKKCNLGHLESAIWIAKVQDLICLIKCHWPDSNHKFFNHLDTCRLVVNVYKHGGGSSLELLNQNPEFFKEAYRRKEYKKAKGYTKTFPERPIDFKELEVEDAHLDQLSQAITDFWLQAPDTISMSQISKSPKWFLKAWGTS